MLKYILVITLVLLISGALWVLNYFELVPTWVAILVTAVGVFIVLLMIGISIARRIRARRERAKAMKAPPSHAEEAITAMQNECERILTALAAAETGGKNRKSPQILYKRHWCMVMGTGGSGKSTLLRNSGLEFDNRFVKGKGGSLQQIANERNSVWDVTDKAVFIDTPGRYHDHEEDRHEWLAFLDVLQKNRPKRAVDGVVIAVDIHSIARASEEEVIAQARMIRARLHDVRDHLHLIVPTYIVFSKCDQLPGFQAMFSDLSNEDRRQIFGMTAPIGTRETGAAEWFDGEFEVLSDSIRQRAFRRISNRTSPEECDPLYGFPQIFADLKQHLVLLMSKIFARQRGEENLFLRGVYFTSAIQEGEAGDPMMDRVFERYGLVPQVPVSPGVATQTMQRGYFLTHMLTKVISRDRSISLPTNSYLRQLRLRQLATLGGVFTGALTCSVLPGVSARRNHELLTQATHAVDEIAAHRGEEKKSLIRIEQLDQLHQVERTLNEHKQEGRPVLMMFGLYQGEEIYPYLEKLYSETIRQQIILPILQREVEELEAFSRRYEKPNTRADSSLFLPQMDRLRMYLLLTGSEKLQEQDEKKWLSERLTNAWIDRLHLEAASNDRMSDAITTYVDILALKGADGKITSQDEGLVNRVREILKRTDRVSPYINELVVALEKADYRLTLGDFVSSSSFRIVNDTAIRSAFTRDAWEKKVRDELPKIAKRLTKEDWILGLSGDQTGLHETKLRSHYFNLYIHEWEEFLKAIYVVVDPIDKVQAQKILDDLLHGSPHPMAYLFERVAYNVDLREKPKEEANGNQFIGGVTSSLDEADQAVELRGGGTRKIRGDYTRIEDVPRKFTGFTRFGSTSKAQGDDPAAAAKDAPFKEYAEQLEFIRDELMKLIDSPGDNSALMERLRTAEREAKKLIARQEVGWRPDFDRILLPPIRGVLDSEEQRIGASLASSWCDEVYRPFHRSFVDRYPFKKDTEYDVVMADFTAFFQPDKGKLWQYYQNSLKSHVIQEGDHFTLAPVGRGSKVKFNPALVQFFNYAHDLTVSMFPEGSPEVQVEFRVLIQITGGSANISEVRFVVDGHEEIQFTGSEKWNDFIWPGKDGDPGASIVAQAQKGVGKVNKTGAWGFLRLLEEGTVEGQAGNDTFTVVWDLRDQGADKTSAKVDPLRRETPFFGVPERGKSVFMNVFRARELTPPSTILKGGPACATD